MGMTAPAPDEVLTRFWRSCGRPCKSDMFPYCIQNRFLATQSACARRHTD